MVLPIHINRFSKFKYAPGALVPRPNFVDLAKAMAEKCPFKSVIRWSLQPTNFTCFPEKTRISWTCACDFELHIDVLTKVAQQCERHCASLGAPSNLRRLPIHIAPISAPASGVSQPLPTATSAPGALPQGVTRVNNRNDIANAGHAKQTKVGASISGPFFIHFESLKDTTVLPRFKKLYRNFKGYRFKRIDRDKEIVTCLKEGKNLPSPTDLDSYYAYTDPSNVFTSLLGVSMRHLLGRYAGWTQHAIQDILSQIPKKTRSKLSMEFHQEGFGMRAVPGWEMWRIVTIIVVPHVCLFAFAIFWLVHNPGALSDVFAPKMCVAAFQAL
ncbi:uncharacterized protein RSE6_02233 [Rhynchosporium secalis]|uniref:Uncharacterized protein n=1 Tax=Rhynchosporium secalis TaxID=38038 RepID=A0A1E1LZS4_RHYSE|nr:uncharacterized protein RSE6_02233 [Rhynchosporium secalis]